ncbi:MAG TPA: methionyl-tRNA formyltransferase [Holophaga sp.]|nr:methionyl-tRNA formyltransferase [Holophaga sp.]
MSRIAFLGTPGAAVPVLRALAGAREVAAVFCNPDRPVGRGRHLEAPPVKKAALELGLPVHQPLSWKAPETREAWEALGIDLAIVVAYGHILPRWMLEGCPLGAWNLHFSLLPRWRGAAPVNHALLAGDAETGVGLMGITPGLDEGPVLAQSRRPITLGDTAEGLLETLAQDAAHLLLDHLPALEGGTARPLPQAGEPTFAPKLHKGMAPLDPGLPALHLHRQVRALAPWPGTELDLEGSILKVCAVGGLRPSGDPAGTLAWGREGAWLTAGDGQALELILMQRPGKPIQPAGQALQPLGTQGRKLIPRRA